MTDENNDNNDGLKSLQRRRLLQAGAAGAALLAVPKSLQTVAAQANALPSAAVATAASTPINFNVGAEFAKLSMATSKIDIEAFGNNESSYSLPKRDAPHILEFGNDTAIERFIDVYAWFCRGLHALSSTRILQEQDPEFFAQNKHLQSDDFLLGVDPVYENPRTRYITEKLIRTSYNEKKVDLQDTQDSIREEAEKLISDYRALNAQGVLPEAEAFLQKIITGDVSISEFEGQASLYEARHIVLELLKQSQDTPLSLKQMEQGIKDYNLQTAEGFSPKRFQQKVTHYVESLDNKPMSESGGFDPACAPISLYDIPEVDILTPEPNGRVEAPKQLDTPTH